MSGTGRDSTDEWIVYDARLVETPGNGDRTGAPPPEPDALAAAQRAASEAAACASRAAASSSAAAAAVERVERSLGDNRDAVQIAGEAAEAAERSAATATAIGEQAEKTLERVEWRIEAVAASVDASHEFAETLEQGMDHLYKASLEAGSRAKAAAELAERAGSAAHTAQQRAEDGAASAAASADKVNELAGRVEVALVKLEARERATVRRSKEAEREDRTLRNFTARADRIVERLRELEERASPASVWRLPPDTGE